MKFRAEVAGHYFQDDTIDSPCVRSRQHGGPCAMTRSLLFTAMQENVGYNDWAHIGVMNQAEFNEIREAKRHYEEHCEKMMEALRQVCG